MYSGKEDFICNYLGGQEWVNATKWDGMKEFNAAPYKDWHVDGKVAGEVFFTAGYRAKNRVTSLD